jgi:hypothetical protein
VNREAAALEGLDLEAVLAVEDAAHPEMADPMSAS